MKYWYRWSVVCTVLVVCGGSHRLCAPEEEGTGCELKARGERLTCRGSLSPHSHRDYTKTKLLTLCQWPDHDFDPVSTLVQFHSLQKLVIRHSNISRFLSNFPPVPRIETLVLSDLLISHLPLSIISDLDRLRVLDLTNNLLKRFDQRILLQHPTLSQVFLSGNPWDCTESFSWVFHDESSVIADRDEMKCDEDSFPGKPLSGVTQLIESMEKDCLRSVCVCNMTNIVWGPDRKYLIPVITVDCSARGLQQLPRTLPHNTTTLYLRHNNISDLESLVSDPLYHNIADLYLDDNMVSSLDSLEGAEWLKNFRVLSLRGNYLTELPIYALEDAFERNNHMAKVYLGNNPWRCDCLFTPELQRLLVKYSAVMKDAHDVRCAELQDDETSLVQITELSKSTICQEPSDEVNPLDVLSGVLACLIVLLIGKLVYDYWAFKRTGKLPWIVAKMP